MKRPLRWTLLGVLCLWPSSFAWAQTATVNLAGKRQVIRGFGGMHHPGWQGGGLTANQMALAFGNGEGQLGLTILRIPVDENTNAWANSVSNAQTALSLGALVFASPWNPPHGNDWRVQNGTSDGKPKMYLREDRYADYAAHLNAFYDYMTERGVELHSISVQNEPDWGHDWTWWSGPQLVKFLKEQGPTLKFRVMAPESFGFNTQGGGVNVPVLDDPDAWAQVDVFGTHMYGTPTANMSWPALKQGIGDREMWMTEVYTDSHPDGLPGQPAPPTPPDYANEWPRALRVAKSIHDVLVVGEFQAYVWWYIERSYSFILLDTETISKRGWCMAHFSRFVRPGFRRVEVTERPIEGQNVFVSAFEGDSSLAVVLVNQTDAARQVTVAVPGTAIETFSRVTTSASKSFASEATLTVSGGSVTLTLDPQSVSTLYGREGGAPGECVAQASNAFGGTPRTLPGLVEAEDFDVAGYFDGTTGNEGGAYRSDVDVDIKPSGDGYTVGWMTSGEWLQYTVNVPRSGDYLVTFRTGATSADRTLNVSVCGAAAGSVTVPQVDDWDRLASVTTTLRLNAGLQVLRLTVGEQDYLDLDSMTFEFLGGDEGLGGAGSGSGGATADDGSSDAGTDAGIGDVGDGGSGGAGCGCVMVGASSTPSAVSLGVAALALSWVYRRRART